MGDYFDEDDLIDDYIAGAAEDEPPFEEYVRPCDEDDPADADGGGEGEGEDGIPETFDNASGAALGIGFDSNAAKKTSSSGEKDICVPRLISTSLEKSTAPASPQPDGGSGGDLYGFERYSGLSSWRTKSGSGGNNDPGGASTMEASGWKKMDQTGLTKGQDGDGCSFGSNDDQENGHVCKRDLTKSTAIMSRGGMRGEAQLVRHRECEEKDILGRSWGRIGAVSDGVRRACADPSDLPALGEDSVPITLAGGTRTFVKRAGRRGDAVYAPSDSDREEGCLLGTPMVELVKRADAIQRRAIRRRIEREGRSSGSRLGTHDGAGSGASGEGPGTSHDEAPESAEAAERASEANHDECPSLIATKLKKRKRERELARLRQRLWVDKHAPANISHLLSDERTNREVLRALRAWDPYVFKREAPARPAQTGRSGHQRENNIGDAEGKAGDRKPNKEGAPAEGVQADIRPDERSRVILLSGPPGVGKSTLAHVCCKHAGYRPVEVNASDERTASSLTERVARAMESSTLNLEKDEQGVTIVGRAQTTRGRPNCIILDEIDGADGKASLTALIEIVRAEIPLQGNGGKKGSSYLRRPVILICNHKYAQSIRPILPYARQFDVRPPSPERLVGRLRAVLAAERMSVVGGGMLLNRLAAASGGDVRSCLHALQFASARAREMAIRKNVSGEVEKDSVVDVSSALMASLRGGGRGMKDVQGDAASTVTVVFRKLKPMGQMNKRRKLSSGNSSVREEGVNLVLKAVDRFGDNSKTLDCLFMNVSRVSYVDPALDRCSTALEWLSEADIYRSHKNSVAMNNSAEHQAMQRFHIPSAVGAVHLLCRVETRPDLTFATRPLAELRFKNDANIGLALRFAEGLAPRIRRGAGAGTDVLVREVIPYGLWLLSAGEGKHALSRPASSVDVLSPEERHSFEAHVATLRALGLTYIRDESRMLDYDGNTGMSMPEKGMRLEPEIDRLVRFECMDSEGGRRDVPPVLKELLAHGATVEAMREREGLAQAALQETQDSERERQKTKDEKATPPKATKKAIMPGIPAKKLPSKVGSNTSAAKNFLGIRAARAKEARSARRAARVGFDRSKKVKLSNTGSGKEMSRVIRFRHQKGFTQAVRAPCRLEDLL